MLWRLRISAHRGRGGGSRQPGYGGLERRTAPPERVEADLWVIGPEVPLVDGLADRIRARGGLVFGPGADGARLEGSKVWMKESARRGPGPDAGSRAFRRSWAAPSNISGAVPAPGP